MLEECNFIGNSASLKELLAETPTLEFVMSKVKLIVGNLMKSSKDQYIECLLKQLRLANIEMSRLQREG